MTAAASRIVISHAGRDRAWAEWARWHLQSAGYATELDSADWAPGTNFVEAMHNALSRQNPMLVLLSTAYLDPDKFTTDEWTARLAQRRKDPEAKLIPVRIENVDLRDGLWAPIVVSDVYDLAPEQAVRMLLTAVRQVVDPPAAGAGATGVPPYPGARTSVAEAGPRPPGSLPTVWNLARRNLAFTGRDSMLNRLHDTLCAGNRAAVQALYGMGGVGKTQLALEYAHRFAGEYDLVWWIPAEQSELIGDHLASLAAKVGLVTEDTTTPAAVEALREHLRVRPRWLLVFDNAEERDDLTAWLPDGPGHLIITSRSPAWTGVAQPVDVDVFVRDESVALLHTHLPSLDDRDADRLADALGDLPLAVGQAADLLAETRISVDAYLHELREHAADLLRDGRPPAGYPLPLAAAVTVAAHRLSDDDAAAGELLALYAHLGPEPIPDDLFLARPALLRKPLARVARRPVAFARTVAQLGRYGLARLTDDGPLLHRLTQAILRDTDPDSDAHRRTVEQLLISARPDDPATPAWWPRWTQLLPHILAADPATTGNLHLRWTADAAVWHLLARGDARTALPLAEHLHAAWTGRHGPDDDTTLAITHTLASIYGQLGRYESARHLDEDTLNRRRRLHGYDHPNTLGSANNLADGLRELGEYERARELDEDTLARRMRLLGEDHPFTLSSAGNFAVDLRELGEHERARDLHEKTLARARRVLGDDHPNTLSLANDLAGDLRAVGEFEWARQLDSANLERRRRVLGVDHPDTLASASALAADLRGLGKFARAREVDEDNLARLRRVLGDEHPDTVESVGNLVTDLVALGEEAEADRLRCAERSTTA
ncbi:FxSxx-COOH system tetratricopeptide repeat protein [Actinoplanes sp. NPDC049681]|uniref:FxSxx-COOH system tetratricopeptide repeat protein n=1 Tax=Actinoplanes sp. NPDC049681 TaxID=3363905 RepID=UPI00379D2FA7